MAAVDVDSTLQHLRALLGSGPPATLPFRTFGTTVTAPDDWTGMAADRARSADAQLDGRRQQLSTTYSALTPVLTRANQVAEHARNAVDAVVAQWQADKTALQPVAGTPAGKAALLRAASIRVEQVKTIVAAAQREYSVLAGQVQLLTGRFPTPNGASGGAVQALGFGELPQGPFFPPPESPWEYNLDFTSDVEAGSFDYPGVTNAGQVTSIEDAWKELNRCFNCNFPMGGAPSKLPAVGDELPLEIRIAGQQLPLHFPVRVTQIQKTANDINIEFATLPGHVDGTDSTIHFHFFEQGGQLHLGIRGLISNGPGSEDIPVWSPLARSGYTQVAQGVWQPYIDRLTRHVAEAKGLNVYGGR
jgi:hypothetical protein